MSYQGKPLTSGLYSGNLFEKHTLYKVKQNIKIKCLIKINKLFYFTESMKNAQQNN